MKVSFIWVSTALLCLTSCSTRPTLPAMSSGLPPREAHREQNYRDEAKRTPATTANTESINRTVVIDGNAPEKPFPHFWELAFGSGRAILTTSEQYRQQLRSLKKVTDVQYVRFHEIFSDDVGVYREDEQGVVSYNFTYVDEIYDGLLAIGVRPIVELSYMPKKLALRPDDVALFSSAVISPPKDYRKWDDLVRAFAEHLIQRYGIKEVATWYFEVWNEARWNWTGSPQMETYFELYNHSALALKSVNPALRVGGPVSSAGGWIDEFLSYVKEHNLPVDFISSHAYADDNAQEMFGDPMVPMEQRVCRAIKQTHEKIRRSHKPNLPLLWTEWSVPGYGDKNARDSIYVASGLAETVSQCDGLVDIMAYWTFSDVFDEAGVMEGPFTGWFGIQSVNGIQKPGFHGFELLHRLGDRRLKNDARSVLVSRRRDGGLSIAAWNLVPHGENGPTHHVHFEFSNLPKNMRVQVLRVDETHSNTRGIFHEMGDPKYPTRAQIAEVNRRGALQAEQMAVVGGKLDLDIPREGVVLIETPSRK